MSGKWNVWSIDHDKERALVVDEGTQAHAERGAETRNASAKRLNVGNLEFVALPDGQKPFDA